MATKDKAEKVPAFSASVHKVISAAYSEMLKAASATGAIVTNLCDTARKATGNKALEAADIATIAGNVADVNRWKDRTRVSRISEITAVLKAYQHLPEAVQEMRDKASRCSYHDAIKLARKLAGGESVKKAVAMVTAPPAEKAAPVPRERVTKWLREWHKHSPKMRDSILKAAGILNIDLVE